MLHDPEPPLHVSAKPSTYLCQTLCLSLPSPLLVFARSSACLCLIITKLFCTPKVNNMFPIDQNARIRSLIHSYSCLRYLRSIGFDTNPGFFLCVIRVFGASDQSGSTRITDSFPARFVSPVPRINRFRHESGILSLRDSCLRCLGSIGLDTNREFFPCVIRVSGASDQSGSTRITESFPA